MAGADMLTFVNLARGGVERHPLLLDWVCAWTEWPGLKAFTPEGWFKEGHGITGGAVDPHRLVLILAGALFYVTVTFSFF
jgi:hypothetical protein